jgi:hypothetical protein
MPESLISQAIQACKAGDACGICGQRASDHPDPTEWLVAQGSTASRSIPIDRWSIAGSDSAATVRQVSDRVRVGGWMMRAWPPNWSARREP